MWVLENIVGGATIGTDGIEIWVQVDVIDTGLGGFIVIEEFATLGAAAFERTIVVIEPVLPGRGGDEYLGGFTAGSWEAGTTGEHFERVCVSFAPGFVDGYEVDVGSFPGAGFVYATTEERGSVLESQGEWGLRFPGEGRAVSLGLDDLGPGTPAAEFGPERTLEVGKIGADEDSSHGSFDSVEDLDD